MIKSVYLKLVAAAIFAAAFSYGVMTPAHSTPIEGKVRASCGAESYTAGSTGTAIFTTTGILCGNTVLGAQGSGAVGGLPVTVKTCDQHAKYDASDNGSITLVTGVASRKIYVCGFIMATGGTATNLKLVEGSNANCAAGTADLTPAYQLVANDKVGAKSAFWDGLAVSTNAFFICINASAGNAHQAEIWYTIQ